MVLLYPNISLQNLQFYMIQTFTIYSLFFLVTALVSFFGAFLSWHRRKVKGAIELTWLLIASGTGAFWVIFETAAPTVVEKIFWSKLEFMGGAFTPVLYLIFVLKFTGNDQKIKKRDLASLFIVPIITYGLILTNDRHHLIWSGYSAISEKTNIMEYYHGVCFWIGYVFYSYVMLFTATVYIVTFTIRHKKSFRYQGWIILLGGLMPWLASIFYLVGINITPGLDLTPASITISGILLIYGIFHNRLLDLAPVARETLFETIQDGILALDDRNRIQDINEAAIKYLGISQKNVLGLLAQDSGATAASIINAAIKSGSVEQIEVSDGSETKTFRIIKQPIKNQPGSRLVVIRDISDHVSQQKELILAKERAEESDRLKSAFLANMSHEIRTPMNGILGFTELLKEPKLTGEEQQEYIKIIENSGTRMLNIINDIINISKLEVGLIKTTISEVDLIEQISFIYNFFKPQADEKGLTLSLNNSLLTTESKIYTDKEKVYSILTNLTKNAIKFTDSGTIEIGCSRYKNSLLFWIKDTGIGIPESQKSMIFERFRQGSESVTRNYEGAGLGLSISKAYVELIGGKIWLESKEGEGSTFFFTIPAVAKRNTKDQ